MTHVWGLVSEASIFFSAQKMQHSEANQSITRNLVQEADRIDSVDKLFGINSPMRLEPSVFDIARRTISV